MIQHDKSNLNLLSTYWPSGSSAEALDKRNSMEATVQSLIAEYHKCTPIVLGDMKATYIDGDRSSSYVYEADKMY